MVKVYRRDLFTDNRWEVFFKFPASLSSLPPLTKHIASEQRNENNGLREEDILWSSSRHRRSWSVIARWIKISIISFFINTHEHGLLAHSTIETAAAGGDLMAAKDEQMRWRCSPRTSNYLLSLLVIVLMSSVAGFLLL